MTQPNLKKNMDSQCRTDIIEDFEKIHLSDQEHRFARRLEKAFSRKATHLDITPIPKVDLEQKAKKKRETRRRRLERQRKEELVSQGLSDFIWDRVAVMFPRVSHGLTEGFEFVSNMSEASGSAKRIVLKTEEAIQGMNSTLVRALETLSDKGFQYHALIQSTLTLSKWLIDPPGYITMFIDILSFLISIFKDFLLTTCSSLKERFNVAITNLLENFHDRSDQHVQAAPVVSQGGEEMAIGMTLATSIVTLVSTALVGTSMTASPELMKKTKTWGELGKSLGGIKSLLSNMHACVAWIFESITSLVTSAQGASLVKTSAVCARLQIDDKVIAVIDHLCDPSLVSKHMLEETDYKNKLVSLRHLLLQAVGERAKKSDPRLIQFLNNKIRSIEEVIRDNAQQFLSMAARYRIVPFCAHFFGDSGVGKSVLTQSFAQHMMDERMCGENLPNRRVASKTSANKHWDGYHGETALIMDDAFMTRGSSPTDSEYAQFINLISNVSWQVPKAAVAEKGLGVDDLRLVIVTSNIAVPQANEINNPEAMKRRRHVVWKVSRKMHDDGYEDPYNNHCLFQMHDSLTNKPLGGHVSYSSMLRTSSAIFRKHLRDQNTLSLIKPLDDLFFEAPAPSYANAVRNGVPENEDMPIELPADVRELLSQAWYEQFLPEEQVDREVTIRGKLIPIYSMNNRSQWLRHNAHMCCIPDSLYPQETEISGMTNDRLYYDNFCNQRFSLDGGSLMSWNEDWWELSTHQRATFESLVCAGLPLPPRKYYRAYGVEFFNDILPTAKQDIPLHELYPLWFASRYFSPSLACTRVTQPWSIHVKIYGPLAYGNDIEDSESDSDDDDADMYAEGASSIFSAAVDYALTTSSELYERRIKIALNLMAAAAAIFLAISYWEKIKAALGYCRIALPKVNMNAKSLRAFVDSFPSLYREHVLSAVTEVVAELEDTVHIATDSLTRGPDKIPGLSLQQQGLTYDGAPPNTKTIALRVQSAFASKGIATTTVAKDIVRHLHSEGLADSFLAKKAKIVRNIVMFGIPERPGLYKIQGLAMGGRRVMVPHHFLYQFEGCETLQLTDYQGVVHNFSYSPDMVASMGRKEECDAACLTLPLSIREFAHIDKFLIREKNLNLMEYNADGCLVRGTDSTSIKLTVNTSEMNYTVINNLKESLYKVRLATGLRYAASTQAGDCGSPVLLENNSIEGVIVGFHVAGGGGDCLGQLMSYEKWTAFVGEPDKDFVSEGLGHTAEYFKTQDPEEIELLKKIQNDDQLPAIAIVDKKFERSPAKSTNLEVSSLTSIAERNGIPWLETERGPPTFSLSDLRVSEETRASGIQPLSRGLNKYKDAPQCFPAKTMALAFATITTLLSTILPKNFNKRLLTDEETLNGLDNDMIPPVDLNTSVGYPFVCLSQGVAGKKSLLLNVAEPGEQVQIVWNETDTAPRYKGKPLSMYCRQLMTEAEDMMRRKVIPAYLIYENMKDELVAKKKFAIAKVRTFECLPLHILLLSRKYYGMFMGAMKQNCVQGPISVGIVPTDMDWTHLYNRLTRFGKDSLIAGDYSNWDGHLMADVMMKCAEVVNAWYGDKATEEENNVRTSLMLSYTHAMVLAVNTVVKKRSGMPSGVPVTAPINSLANMFYLVSAIIDLHEANPREDKEELTPTFIISNIEMATYGDDHILALSAYFRQFVNFKTLQAYFASKSIPYTDSQKRDATTIDFEFESIHEITYLKRRFQPDAVHPRIIRSPLAIESITDEIYWSKKSKQAGAIQVFHQRCTIFEQDLAMHDRATYERYIQIYNSAIQKAQELYPHRGGEFVKIYTTYKQHSDAYYKRMGVMN